MTADPNDTYTRVVYDTEKAQNPFEKAFSALHTVLFPLLPDDDDDAYGELIDLCLDVGNQAEALFSKFDAKGL